MSSDPLLHFGPYRLDVGSEQLWRDSQLVRLTPKALRVLRALVHSPGQLVTKEELFRGVWPETIVSDAALTSCIQELRQALGDNARTPRYIETAHRRGFRFIATLSSTPPAVSRQLSVVSQTEEVSRQEEEERQKAKVENTEIERETDKTQPSDSGLQTASFPRFSTQDFPPPTPTGPWLRKGLVLAGVLFLTGAILTVYYLSRPTLSPQSLALSPDAAPAALPLPDKPSIIVLPFVNLSGDPAQEYFSDGVTEEITATLSRVSSLFVIARTSAFTYKGKAAKVQDISREMGVRYVLEGSVLKANGQVRITVQLIDATTGGHLWSGRYDRALRDIFTLQDEIGRKVVTALKVNLMPEEQERFRRAPTTNLEAYDYFLRGYEFYWQETKETNTQARQLFEQAVTLDPQYAGAYAGLSFTYIKDWVWQWNQDRQTLEHAFDAAQKALALDDALPLAYVALATAYQNKNQQDQAIIAAERAIALSPNSAAAYMSLAELMGLAGRPEEGIAMAKTAMRLNPHYPPWYLLRLGMTYHQAWRNDEAIAALKRFLVYYPNSLNAHIGLTCSYSDAGREEEARAQAAEVSRLSPNFTTETWQQNQFWRETAEMERHLNNLRKAGLK